ncbi:hypothetical protein KC350_g41 [Hortaea werneckii]|nr:hypothetical protein KC350_g41 [Hortaea werneckii]
MSPRNDILGFWKSSKRSFGRRLKLEKRGSSRRCSLGCGVARDGIPKRDRMLAEKQYFFRTSSFISLDRPFRFHPKWLQFSMRYVLRYCCLGLRRMRAWGYR